jgi:uncharacterized protein (DUF1499 family)
MMTASDQPATARLAPCPGTPNCVSSLARDPMHAIAPIAYTGDLAAAKAALLNIVAEMPRSKVVADERDYMHVEFRSLVFRFVDDVEFAFDDTAKLIHFRAAARLGRGDLGVNRRRMERIRRAFTAYQSSPDNDFTKKQEDAASRA